MRIPKDPSQFVEAVKEEVEDLLGNPAFRRPVVKSVLEQIIGLQESPIHGNLVATPGLIADLKARIDPGKTEQFKDVLAQRIQDLIDSPAMREEINFKVSEMFRQTVQSWVYSELESVKQQVVRQIKKTAREVAKQHISAWQNPGEEQ